MHGGIGERLLAKPKPDLCYGCHLEIRAKFALPEHHKLSEGVSGAATATSRTAPGRAASCVARTTAPASAVTPTSRVRSSSSTPAS
jgi:hypothetical protein